jgi:putative transposase
MRAHDLYARRRRRKARTTNSQHRFPIASNLLKRDFTSDAQNKKRVADITFVETREWWIYLLVVLDTYSSKIVLWLILKKNDTNMVEDALQMTL